MLADCWWRQETARGERRQSEEAGATAGLFSFPLEFFNSKPQDAGGSFFRVEASQRPGLSSPA
jgi:hypothetical protein